jgi:hypothetical protein
MRAWPALLLAPLTALAQQSICLSLVVHSCRQQTTLAMHVVCAVSLALILAFTVAAFLAWRESTGPAVVAAQGPTSDTSRARIGRFVAIAGTLVGTLSALVAILMWMPIWVLGPCMA